jgi:hypothetical protein
MAGTESDADVMSFTESSGPMASKSRQAVDAATGGAFSSGYRRLEAKVNRISTTPVRVRRGRRFDRGPLAMRPANRCHRPTGGPGAQAPRHPDTLPRRIRPRQPVPGVRYTGETGQGKPALLDGGFAGTHAGQM